MKKQLQEKRTQLLAQSEAIRLKYDGKPGEMTGAETEEWTNILSDVDHLQKQIDLLDREETAREWGKSLTDPLAKPTGKDGEISDEATRKGHDAWNRFLKGGRMSLSEQHLASIAGVTSTKAYQADDPAGGGFLVMPQQMATEMLTLMKDLVFMRRLARTFSLVRAESLGVPSIDTDPSDADWTTELGTGSEESTMAFGKRELRPHPVAKRIKLSNKLIRQVPNAETVVQDRLGYKFQITEEKAFLTGSGANQPLGVFTASNNGISTSRDKIAASATVLTGDDFIGAAYNLKAQYRAKAQWIISRPVLEYARKLKDSTNNYIWSTGLGPGGGLQGTPETLCGRPINESEYAPSTQTAGLYVAVLGDFSHYWIADALDMQLQVLDQLYAETNQMGYILRKETDGMPVQGEAFTRLRML